MADLTPEEIKAKIQFQTDGIPDGDSKFQQFTSNKYVKGAFQTFLTIEELIAFHPNKLVQGQSCNVVELSGGVPSVTTYILMADPTTMFNPSTLESFVTNDTFLGYWAAQTQTLSNFDRVNEYAPDGANGTKPPYPYEDNVGFEANWSPVFDVSKGHKWLRFRDDDVDDNDDNIFDNWTIPIAVGNTIAGGDFIANAYARETITPTVATTEGELVTTDLGADNSGHYQVTVGNIDVTDVNLVVTNLTVGKYFKYIATSTYVFNNSASALQLLPPPPRTINGLSNDAGVYTVESGLNAIIFQDDIPVGTDTLQEIIAQKSVYGGLKSAWSIRIIAEDPNLTRYSAGYIKNPNTVVGAGTDDDCSDPSTGNTNLNTAGWVGEFLVGATYLATRETTGSSPAFTEWNIQKIAGESGEFKDRVFKLFELNKDVDDVLNEAPVGADAISEGWADTPLTETDSLINYVSEATKFFNGELKTPWSIPVPYTGQDTFNDLIVSADGFTFKYLPNSNDPSTPDPTELTLEARLFKGITPIWVNSANDVTYSWERVYNNGAIDNTVADNDSGKDFYTLPTSGTPDQDDYIRISQTLRVNADGVDGKAVFECTQTFTLPDATTVVFKEQVEVVDITDGLDAKDLSVSADSQIIIRDTVAIEFAPANIVISAYQNNLPQPATFYWWLWNGATWDSITSGVGGYVITPTLSGSRLDVDVEAAGFTTDDQLDEKKYAVTNYNGQPDENDNITKFADQITLSKTSSAGIGSPGENSVAGILDNETYNILLDAGTEIPFAGELGASGKASTLLQVYDGGTLVATGAGAGLYTAVLGSDNGNVTFGQVIEGSNLRIYADTWNAGERKANCTATISYETGDARGTIVFTKVFSLNSTLDQVGAILAIIEGVGGRTSFTADDRNDITLEANLYNDAKTPTLQPPTSYYYRWGVAGNAPTGAWINNQYAKVVTRENIRTTGTVVVQIADNDSPDIPDGILRTAEIRITDILDGKTIRLYSTNAINNEPTKPPETVDETGDAVTWFPDAAGAIWAVDGTEKPLADWPNASSPRYEWSNVYQIGGEVGDQGDQGGGYYAMYSSIETPVFPSGINTSSIDDMAGGDWLYRPPNTDIVWKTERLYKGFTAQSDSVKLDGNGKLVGTDFNEPAEPVTGSVWGEPTLISGGIADIPLNGWSPVIDIRGYSNGTRLLFVKDWVGGSGTKPSTGYITEAGIGAPNENGNVKGDKGDTGDTGVVDGAVKIMHFFYQGGNNTNFYSTTNFDMGDTNAKRFQIQMSAEVTDRATEVRFFLNGGQSTGSKVELRSWQSRSQIKDAVSTGTDAYIVSESVIYNSISNRHFDIECRTWNSGVHVKALYVTITRFY